MRASFFAALISFSPAALGYGVAAPRFDPAAPSARVEGTADVSDVRVTVRCRSTGVFERGARCTVEGRFVLVARGGVTLRRGDVRGDAMHVGAEATAVRAVADGERVRVTVTATREFETRTGFRSPWVIAPMVARHPGLGDSDGFVRHAGTSEVAVVSGPSLTFVGEVALDADGDRRVAVSAGAGTFATRNRRPAGVVPTRADEPDAAAERRVVVSMDIAPRRDSAGPLRNGGPVLALGSRIPLSDETDRLLLRGAWEVSLWEHLFVSAGAETDFDSVFESAVVDVASPGLAVIIPSFRAGVGVVARQLGPRPADFALRLRLGANLFSLGGDVDVDYWPATTGWTLSITGRLSP